MSEALGAIVRPLWPMFRRLMRSRHSRGLIFQGVNRLGRKRSATQRSPKYRKRPALYSEERLGICLFKGGERSSLFRSEFDYRYFKLAGSAATSTRQASCPAAAARSDTTSLTTSCVTFVPSIK
jgi:hypothetical protein